MKISTRVLKQILPDAEFHNVKGDEEFGICNIARLKDFEKIPSGIKTLYFLVYEDNPKTLGWYKEPFDRSKNLYKLKVFNHLVFVVDSRVKDEQLDDCSYIRVNDIYNTIDAIREYVLSFVHPIIIGTTGSVGKTTGTALIESILSQKFSCGRIYSKRLTPLVLSSWIANFLLPSHQVLALEYSMYRKHHISDLIRLLKPSIGVFLNIKKVHFGVLGINNFQDILEGKKDLVNVSNTGILNADDSLILSLRRKNDLIFSCENKKADAFVGSDGATAYLHLNCANQVIPFVPYVKTKLFYYQVASAGLVGSLLGVSASQISTAINDFVPAENRIQWIDVHGERVLFDGDVTTGGRLSSLSENDYMTSLLLIHSFDFGEENVELQVNDIISIFSSFSEVRILDAIENREIVSKYSFKNIIFSEKEVFFDNLKDFEFRVFHFAIYFRKYKDMSFLIDFINT